MIHIGRTNAQNSDFIALVSQLDQELAERDGAEHDFYDQFNKINDIKYAVVTYSEGKPVGCGAIKALGEDTAEVKRMFVEPASRGKGIASKILAELEAWALELCFEKCRLETGKKQPEAIALYTRNGYVAIPNYGQYAEVENSCCFEKQLHFLV